MAVALFGGTFNPVHTGHLRIATELAELLQVDQPAHAALCAPAPSGRAPAPVPNSGWRCCSAALANQSLLVADDIRAAAA